MKEPSTIVYPAPSLALSMRLLNSPCGSGLAMYLIGPMESSN